MNVLTTEIANILSRANNIAVLTGAGISAENGIPTFRGKDGLWNKYDPTELATPEAFEKHPHIVWEWYQFRRDLINNAQPNAGHTSLVKLAELSRLFTLTTQNVDGLHARSGSRNVLELHGNIMRNRCSQCQARENHTQYAKAKPLPRCECGGLLRPDVVWFGEMLPHETLQNAFNAAGSADVYLVIGTSSLVYPAAGLPQEAKAQGATLIEINTQDTALTPLADFSIRGTAGTVLPDILNRITIRKAT